MTRYTVVWDAELEALYIDMWTKSDSATRAILTAVAAWVDRELILDPELKGRRASEPATYIAAVPNDNARISVAYQVSPDDRLVRVIQFNFRRDDA